MSIVAQPVRLARAAARRLRDRIFPSGVILLYHRVTHLESDPQWLAVSPDKFAKHLDVLSRRAVPLSLNEFAKRTESGRLPRRAVAVTFDDGYADNLLEAKPLLTKAGIPATVFVSTGFTGRSVEFFWDELDRLLLQPGTLPGRLRLEIDGAASEWDLGSGSDYTLQEYKRNAGWNVANPIDPTPRHRVYRELCPLLRNLSSPQRDRVLGDIRQWAGATEGARRSHRVMTADEITALSEGGLVDVGAHTVTHPILSRSSEEAQRAEIQQSRATLTQILGRAPATFSYPFGTRADYTSQTAGIVRECGFAAACSNFSGLVRRGTDVYQLPRMIVRNWDGDQLAEQLRGWFHG